MQLSSERQGSMAREVDYLDTANSFVLDNEDDEELDADPEYLELEKFSQKHRTLAIAWSPETSLNVFPKTVAFCSAASDHKLRLYNSDLAVNSTVQELRGHTDYINAVAYDPYGEYVVSTSDDHTCRVWSLKELPGQCITNIRLLSPGTCSTINTIPGQCITNIRLLSPGTCSTINTIPGQCITNIRLLSPGTCSTINTIPGQCITNIRLLSPGTCSTINTIPGQCITNIRLLSPGTCSTINTIPGQCITNIRLLSPGTCSTINTIPGQCITNIRLLSPGTCSTINTIPGQCITNIRLLSPGTCSTINTIPGQSITNIRLLSPGTCSTINTIPGQCITNIRLLSPGTCSTINTIPGQCITNIRLLSPGTCSTINTIPGHSITNIRLLSPGTCSTINTIPGQSITKIRLLSPGTCSTINTIPGQCITNIRLLLPGTCSTINTIPGQFITNIRLLSPGTCSTINTIPGQSITNIRLLSPGYSTEEEKMLLFAVVLVVIFTKPALRLFNTEPKIRYTHAQLIFTKPALRLFNTEPKIRYTHAQRMSVACHQSEEGKLLVGEKCGVLSLFNLVSGQAILSFDSNRSPLLSADWSPNTSLYAVAVVAGEIVIWDTTNPSHPLETCPAHVEGSECVKFSPLNHSYIATIGQPKHQLKITHLASPHPILVTNLQEEITAWLWHNETKRWKMADRSIPGHSKDVCKNIKPGKGNAMLLGTQGGGKEHSVGDVLLEVFDGHVARLLSELHPTSRPFLQSPDAVDVVYVSPIRGQAALEQVQRNLAPRLCHRLRCNRSGVTLLLVSLSHAALEQVQSNLAPRLCDRLRCNRSGATLFLYAPEIFWSSRTVERKWIRCVLVTALRSGTVTKRNRSSGGAVADCSCSTKGAVFPIPIHDSSAVLLWLISPRPPPIHYRSFFEKRLIRKERIQVSGQAGDACPNVDSLQTLPSVDNLA
uniref:Uncharacterized protein n=1 Tax=Timema bartmani TaxID=61472 RepID=A0A7R9F4E9_9NEOP|nr:unnamed protein product [Timema bartmani]